jgi:hypothetical protein
MRIHACVAVIASILVGACASSKLRTTPELSKLAGKRVALVQIDAEETSRKTIEVALVNQLIKNGTFELISREEVETAKAAFNQWPDDFKGLGSKLGADYVLSAKVLAFNADVHEGYDRIVEDDSLMAKERGEKARKTERLVKVKSLDGLVTVRLNFTNLKDGDVREADATAQDSVRKTSEKEAIHLPPKMSFLQNLAGKAFAQFFEQYQ